MKKSVKLLGLTVLAATMIPIGAYAADSSPSAAAPDSTNSYKAAKESAKQDRKERCNPHKAWLDDVLKQLKLDRSTMRSKLQSGQTLAQIAAEQGVSRNELKKLLIAAFNRASEARKAEFAQRVDEWIDSPNPLPFRRPGIDGRARLDARIDLAAISAQLGLGTDELKQAMSAGRSIADIAREKGVDPAKLIDAEAAALLKQADQKLKDGAITQQQYDRLKSHAARIAGQIVNGAAGAGKHK